MTRLQQLKSKVGSRRDVHPTDLDCKPLARVREKWRRFGQAASSLEVAHLRQELDELRASVERAGLMAEEGGARQPAPRPFDAFLAAHPEQVERLSGKIVAFDLERGTVIASGATYAEVREAAERAGVFANVVFDAVPEP